MADDDECMHLLPKSQCADCTPPARSLADPIVTGPTIMATQTSPCGHDCGDLLEPEQSITMTDEGWIHTSHLPARAPSSDRAPATDTSMFDNF